MSRDHAPDFRPARTEWPTVALAFLVYGAWLGVTAAQDRLPPWILLPAGAWLTAWHMSLQHEVLHGHPTRWRWVNDLIGFPPLSLWLPYARYREQHLGHHRGGNLTDPIDDPESYYVSSEALRGTSSLGRAFLALCNTFAGRLLLGPLRGIAGFLCTEATHLLTGDAAAWRIWVPHLAGVALLLIWLHAACHMALIRYLVFFVYPGFALSLIRSFAEHRAAPVPEHRTAIVENAPVFGMLFLHNNLHVVHHLRPGLPWYRIPQVFRENRALLLRLNGGLVYDGYIAVAARYFLTAHDRPDHPPTG
jgi:fatty acid desaturase